MKKVQQTFWIILCVHPGERSNFCASSVALSQQDLSGNDVMVKCAFSVRQLRLSN